MKSNLVLHLVQVTGVADDVERYFVEQLEKVWPKQQRVEVGFSLQWPPTLNLNELVRKSEGRFVYAATAIRYIGEKGFPENRLEDV